MYALVVCALAGPALCALDVEIAGELAFDLRIRDVRGLHGYRQRGGGGAPVDDIIGTDDLGKKIRLKQTWMADLVRDAEAAGRDAGPAEAEGPSAAPAPAPACLYKIPESKQADAMLSDMLNQLTRVFVRLDRHMRRGRPRAGGAVAGGGGKRYKVVREKRYSFFDDIFANMSSEFRRYFNATTARAVRAGSDPCAHQADMKALWRKLLDNAQASYWSAALHCMDAFVRVRSRSSEPRKHRRLGRFLLRELDTIRASQLAALCRRFRLCYADLL